MSGGLGVLSMAWVEAEASLPLGWQLIGVWRNQDAPGEWVAIASGPIQPVDTETGKGDQPEQALRRLADELRRIREDGERLAAPAAAEGPNPAGSAGASFLSKSILRACECWPGSSFYCSWPAHPAPHLWLHHRRRQIQRRPRAR